MDFYYYYLAFEIAMFILVFICLHHASKNGGLLSILKIFAGICFGLLLEYATIQQTRSYVYGKFPIMLFNEVPLSIGMGWGVIIYSAGLYTDTLAIKNWMKPIIDSLIALNIDLAMDTIAIRLKMWDWGIPLDSQFFGVKWGNFWGWFWVVLSFSFAFRYFSKNKNAFIKYISPFIAIIIGTACVMVTNHFITKIVPDDIYHYVVIATLSSFLILVLYQRPSRRKQILPLPAIAVPFVFHAYFLTAGLISGAVFNPIYILFICTAMITVVLIMQRDKSHSYQ